MSREAEIIRVMAETGMGFMQARNQVNARRELAERIERRVYRERLA